MAAHREIVGHIDAIGGDGVARVLIGDDQDEWFFPLDLLPPGVREGDGIRFADQAGRYLVIGRIDVAAPSRSIEDRLSRPLNVKKTLEVDVGDLQAARAVVVADGAAVTPSEAPRSPGRTRASRQRRW